MNISVFRDILPSIQLANCRELIEISAILRNALEGTMTTIVTAGYATGILLQGAVHILKRSSSRFHLAFDGMRGQYCCQDGCCDRGLQSDVEQVVSQAKELGAAKVIVRTGQRSYYVGRIAGLPVEDVSNHVGSVSENAHIYPAW